MADKQVEAICISAMWCAWVLAAGAIGYGEAIHETANATNCEQTEARP